MPAPHTPHSRAEGAPGGTDGAAASAVAPQSGDIPPALDVQCAFSPDGRLRAKQERCGGRAASYDYTHDERGHLTEVRRDGQVAERYTYNTAGQRITARVNPLPGMSRDALRMLETERAFAYDGTGRLVRAGRARYMYAPDGTLRCREEGRNSTWFYYGNGANGGNGDNGDNTAGGAPHASPDPYSPYDPHDPHAQLAPVALDSVVLPGGDIIRYRFGDNGIPFMVLRNHAPSEEYQWLDPLRLARFRDHRTGSDYTFHYGGDRVPEAVTVCGPALDNLEGGLLDLSIFRKDGEPAAPQRSATFRIGCDQVGTPKVLLDPDGRVVKRMEYDSFGNPLLDTCPYFFLPLGFAGGLVDRHTGLVRFGFRDYDPRTGRFTAPDPLGDTGGDHDPYDYCVDDPVSAFDPLGLIGESVAARGWDESKHPRDAIGRFTFADGDDAMTLEYRHPMPSLPRGSLTLPSRAHPGIYADELLLRPFGPRHGEELIASTFPVAPGVQPPNGQPAPDSRFSPENRPMPSKDGFQPLGPGGPERGISRNRPYFRDGRAPYAVNLLLADATPMESGKNAPDTDSEKTKDNVDTKVHEIAQQLRPWWSYPYGSEEKQEGIAKMQDALKPELNTWGKTIHNIGINSPNGQQMALDYGINHIRSEIKNRKKNNSKQNTRKTNGK
ncbi:RHS repeat-associated core domain-containing protein [Nitratidesulfovibrio termitidis]|uniref:RHS repeat-associated core domain-containing protein n=1 Tax=Nitratidesulfovibrio termitidis TaxID=42252 RepID=UPI000421448D|nr:RHS repeat-associated core domain-containing protein [Nitratidesulfovibrio termitidis]